jgi:hypothetical protein
VKKKFWFVPLITVAFSPWLIWISRKNILMAFPDMPVPEATAAAVIVVTIACVFALMTFGIGD